MLLLGGKIIKFGSLMLWFDISSWIRHDIKCAARSEVYFWYSRCCMKKDHSCERALTEFGDGGQAGAY